MDLVQDRSERQIEPTQARLFMNRGDGSFEPKPAMVSGIDSHGICGFAVDLDNNGLLDLYFAADFAAYRTMAPEASQPYKTDIPKLCSAVAALPIPANKPTTVHDCVQPLLR